MIPATPRRRRLHRAARWLLALLIGLIPIVQPASAWARDPLVMDVVIAGVAASGTQPTDSVTLTGSVTNPSGQPAYGVKVSIWRSTAALRSPDAIAGAVSSSAPPPGRTVSSKPEHNAEITAGAVALNPGESRPFSVRATLAELGLTSQDATYWIGVNVKASVSAKAAPDVTETRTFLTFPGPDPTAVTTVIELSNPPSQVRSNLFANDSLATALSGRLRALLEAAAQPNISWVVDPSLVAEVTDLADGYRVVDGDTSAAGAGAEVAKQWLSDFRALPTENGYQSLFASPDLTTALSVGDTTLLAHARASGQFVGLSLPTLVTLDQVNAETLTALAPLGLPVLSLTPDLPSVWTAVGDARLVGTVSPGSALVSKVLADTAWNRSALLVAQARARGAQVRIVRTQAALDADHAASPSWINRRSLASVLADDPAAWSRTIPVGTGAAPMLDKAASDRIAAVATGTAAYAAVAAGGGTGYLADAVASRGASLAWSGDVAGRDAWLALVDARCGTTALTTGIVVTASPRLTMAAADSEFPVTITNSLPDDVTVRLAAASDNAQRIRLLPSEAVTVKARTSQGVTLRATSSGTGVTTAQIHVETTDGKRLTPDVGIVVEATDLGVIGWIVVVVSGLVLTVSTGLRIRQVRRRNRGLADVVR